jgi:hypothetical protein
VHLRLRRDRAVRSLRGSILIAGALAALSLAAAACGGSPSASVANLGSSTTTTSSTPAGDTSPSQSGNSAGGGNSARTSLGLGGISVQFAQCMRTHGVPNFPDPNGQGQVTMSGVNPQSSSFEAAQRACAKYSPNGGKPPSAAQQQRAVAQALKFSECMRSHGITDFPDPQVSSSGGHVGISIRIKGGQGSNLNPNNPQFEAAQKACQSVAPFGKGAPSPAQTPSPANNSGG